MCLHCQKTWPENMPGLHKPFIQENLVGQELNGAIPHGCQYQGHGCVHVRLSEMQSFTYGFDRLTDFSSKKPRTAFSACVQQRSNSTAWQDRRRTWMPFLLCETGICWIWQQNNVQFTCVNYYLSGLIFTWISSGYTQVTNRLQGKYAKIYTNWDRLHRLHRLQLL